MTHRFEPYPPTTYHIKMTPSILTSHLTLTPQVTVVGGAIYHVYKDSHSLGHIKLHNRMIPLHAVNHSRLVTPI